MCGLSTAVSTLAGWLLLKAMTLEQYFEVLVAGGRSKALVVLKDNVPRSDRQKFGIASPECNWKAVLHEVI